MKKTAILTLGLMLTAFSSFAQITGRVVDATTKEVLAGATVGTEKSNVTTGLDGTFELKTVKAGEKLNVSFIGYKNIVITAKDGIVIELSSTSIGLKEVSVIASYGIDRKTPAAISSVKGRYTVENLGSQELPELLKITPSAFITKGGGGVGDSRINIRGFDQKNVAILINGIPVNDMESGWVYFSNWAGIGDALKQMQVQRGLGASKLAIQSVGGTMNIITKTTDAEKGASFQQSLTDFGLSKSVLSYSTGNTKKGAFSFVGSTTQGNGYVEGTYTKAYSYFLSYAKDLGLNHKLQIIALGAPQEHGQRSSRLTPAEFDKYGVKYNKDLYVLNGELKNININYYHKPIFQINDYWTINKTTTLTTSFYGSIGHGGGSGAIGSYDGTKVLRDAQGHLTMDPQVALNAASTTGSKYGIRNSINNHSWYGVLSTLNKDLSKTLNLTLGVDGRTYVGTHFREMRNLIGGSYYKDIFNTAATVDANASDFININKVTPTNNRIAYDNDGLVKYAGTFGQLEYSKDKLSAFVQGAISNTSYQRADRYYANAVEHLSEKVNITGYNYKGGFNYNLTDKHNVFVNAGQYSRAPYFSFIFNGASPSSATAINSGNAVNDNIKNEQATAVEVGYGFRSKSFRIKANAYYTDFKNRSLTSPLLTNADGTQYRALIVGQGATHKGVEMEAELKVSKKLDVNAFASFGDWKWKGNASATIHDDIKNTDVKTSIFSDGLFVGDQPQTQVGGYARYQLTKRIDLSAIYTFNDKYYAYYDPTSRTNAAVTAQPYKLDSYGITDARIGYKCKVGKFPVHVQYQVYNVFDTNYWAEANDAGGTSVGVLGTGYKGWGRNSNVSVKINF
jgi:outer membrane receptor protein involved in Fe transport